MSFSLHLPHFSAEQVAFGYSAAHETLLALHVFYDCKHHPLHIPWVINARKKINPRLKEEIEAFCFFYQRPIITFWDLREGSAIHSFESDLNDLLNRPLLDFQKKVVEAILNQEISDLSDTTIHERLNNITLQKYSKSRQTIKDLFENPSEIRQRFINLMEAFWSACLKEEWPEMEELLLKDITFRGRKLYNEGIMPLFESLSSEIVTYPDEKELLFVEFQKRRLTLKKVTAYI